MIENHLEDIYLKKNKIHHLGVHSHEANGQISKENDTKFHFRFLSAWIDLVLNWKQEWNFDLGYSPRTNFENKLLLQIKIILSPELFD